MNDVDSQQAADLQAMQSAAATLREWGRLEEACEILVDASACFPNEPGPWHDLARIAEARQEWALAEGCLRRFLALNDTEWWTYASLGAALRKQDRPDEAEAILRSAAERFPNNPGPWHDLARLAESRERWTEAELFWCRFLALDENHWRLHVALADTLRRQNRDDEAAAALRSVIKRFPNETSLWHDLARLEESRQRWPEAEECWRRYLALDESHWRVHLALAEVLREQRCLQQAEAVLSAAEDRFPDRRFTFAEHHASIAEARRDGAEALRRWYDVQTRFPDEWPAHRGHARALRTLGRMDEANAILQSAAIRFPDEVDLWHEWARVEETRGRWTEAEPHWRRVRELGIGSSFPDRRLAAMLREQQRWEEAETILLAAQERFPDECAAFVAQYALIADARGDWPTALERWETYRARFPDEWTGQGGRIRALRNLGRVEEAASLIEAALHGQHEPDLVAAHSDVADVAEPREEHALPTPAAIAAQFESLGGGTAVEGAWGFGCEFGFFQRGANIEPIGLLRWASIAPTSLAAALEARFAGIDTPADLTIRASIGDFWGFAQNRYGIAADHTGLSIASMSAEEAQRRVCRHLGFLSRKLISDLENDEKIFVYRVINHEISEGLLDRLAQAVASYGRNRFLFVRQTPENKRRFTVEVVRPGFMIGYIDRFASDERGANLEGWEIICRAALLARGG
jgi:tetratricopeptide (TPR) repeat protein